MGSETVDAESRVSGNRANIPARVRRALGIDDGDHLRWHLESDGSVRVEVVDQQVGTFADFEGYDGQKPTDATVEHDTWGINGS